MASLSSAQSRPDNSQVDDNQTEHQHLLLSDRYLPGSNPFLATTPTERDINFPPFDQAFLIDSGIVDSSSNSVSGQSGSVGGKTNLSASDSSNNAHLSISARAALAEHNRHVARFGIDDSLEEDDHDVAFPQFVDPLDAEWERLLLNTTNSDVNLSHISPNQSVLSAANYPTNSDEHVVATTSPRGEGIDAIEAATEVSCSDFLNTSRAIDILRTPDRVHFRENDLPSNEGVTIRGGEIPTSVNPWDSSEASFSDDSTRMLRKMYLNSMRSHVPRPSESRSSKSPSSRTRAEEQDSFSLYNVDISRISADDDEDSIAAKTLDHSFTMTGNIFPDPMNNFFSSHSESNTLTPSISNSANRKTASHRHHHQTLSDTNILTPKSDIRWRNSPNSSTTQANRPVASSTNDPEQRYPRNQEETDDDRTIESKLATMALSPISKLAADKAISILQSSPEWNAAFSPTRNSDFTTSTASYRDAKRPQQLMHDDLFLYPNILNSRSDDDDTSPDVIVEFKSGSDGHENDVNDDSKDQFFDYNDDGLSPLHSSSEDKRESDGRLNSHSTPSAATVATPDVLENSGSSEDHLKKNSLSSISPNSSTEHHITTKPTANSSSSLSASTKNTPLQQGTIQNSSINNSQQTWDGFTDRRRYRTVVPIRVFISEPNHFPNEDDSFSSQPKRLSMSLPPYDRSSSKIVGFNHDLTERSIRSSPR